MVILIEELPGMTGELVDDAGEFIGDSLLDVYELVDDGVNSLLDLYKEAKELVKNASESASNAYNEFVGAALERIPKDPLIIDLSGDGLALSSQSDSGVLFDMDGDGVAESTGWVTSDAAGGDDVFLAIDKNGNGNIDSIDELFGNDEMDGFAELSLYDSNMDKLINSSDAQYSLLSIWRDADADGVVDAGEITSLAENGIESISLSTINNLKMINGNMRTKIADVNFTDGTTSSIHEVLFEVDKFNSAVA